MATVDVHETWWIDPRRVRLAIKLGDERLADGLALSAWRIAQEFWVDRRHVPRPKFFELQGAQFLIDVGLAEDQGDFIYVKGTTERHEWRARMHDGARKGGVKSAEKRSLKSLENNSSLCKPSQAFAGPSPSPSPSPSSSPSPKSKNTYAQQVERLYRDLYPRKEGKSGGIKKLAREVTSEAVLAELKLAIENYAERCKNTEPQFIKHFSSFASSWRDWLELAPAKNSMDEWVQKKLEEENARRQAENISEEH